jgi:hypothetical protein
MDYYAGIDVSLESSGLCVMDATGRVVREASRMPSTFQGSSSGLRETSLFVAASSLALNQEFREGKTSARRYAG